MWPVEWHNSKFLQGHWRPLLLAMTFSDLEGRHSCLKPFEPRHVGIYRPVARINYDLLTCGSERVRRAYVVCHYFDFGIESEWFLKVSHVQCESGNISVIVEDRDVISYYTSLIGNDIRSIKSRHLRWPWVTFKVIYLLQAWFFSYSCTAVHNILTIFPAGLPLPGPFFSELFGFCFYFSWFFSFLCRALD